MMLAVMAVIVVKTVMIIIVIDHNDGDYTNVTLIGFPRPATDQICLFSICKG